MQTVGRGEVDGRQSPASSADDRPVLSVVVGHNEQRVRTASCRPTDLPAADRRRRVVDGEIDDGQVDSLMWLDTERSRSLSDAVGQTLAPDAARYNSTGC